MLLFLLVVICGIVPGVRTAYGASGFTMSFSAPFSEVSSYIEPTSHYSVSLSNPVFPPFSRYLKRSPKVVAASDKQHSLRFNTTIYKHRNDSLTLVPVAVDADQYMSTRLKRNLDKKFFQAMTNFLTNPDERKKSHGLGLSVQLPNRLKRVFGEGGAGLRVSGYRKITFSGRSQWTDASDSPVLSQTKFPSLHMEQFYKFDITGTIGTKITVKVSQNSQTDIPLANRLQIRYKGDDDDILKTIEAGNTNLSLPNTQFVGYSSRIQGLFGIKSEAQVGNLRLVGIASQEKGSSERTRVTPSGEESAKIIRDNDYVLRRIFDLGRPGEFQKGDEIISLLVYEELRTTQDVRPGDALYAKLFVNPAFPDSFSSESVNLTEAEAGVQQISPDKYEYFSLPDSNKYYIVFDRAQRDNAIGVQMMIKRGNDTISIGNVGDTAILKLIYEKNMLPEYQVWNLMWRNCYRIQQGLTAEDFDIKIYKGLQNSENSTSSLDYQKTDAGTQTYLEILGMDQYDALGKKIPDGKIDDRFEIFRPDWGLLIFPHRRPFANDTTFVSENGIETQPLADTVHNIYFYTTGTEKTEASRYFLKLFTKSRSTIIRLGRPNIIEGSEVITLNGRQLQKGVGYNIDYSFGQVTLLDEDASDPNADINIDFSYAPFLAVQKKTLLGARAEYEWNKDFKIGTTVLYKSDKAQDRKPRVGQETSKSTVFDIDASLGLHPNFLTSLANALPFYSTESPSNLKLSGELAQSHPNPNVEGKAYIDDFEASAEHLTLGTVRTLWKKSSRPLQVDENEKRGRLLWHNLRDPLRIEDVYDRDPRQGSGTVRSLRLVFRPNYLDTIWDTTVVDEDTTYSIQSIEPAPPLTKSWAGITRYFGGRVDSKRVQLFELRARGSAGAVMHIDFGKVSEDINGDGNAFNEDQNDAGNFLQSEDIGLDGLPDSLEPRYDPITNPDPDGDNWFFLGDGKCPLSPDECAVLSDQNNWNDSLYYEWLNGTEGNKTDYEYLEIPDKESFESGMRKENSYFSYEIKFDPNDPSPFRVDESKFESTDGKEDWYTYRIPIRDPDFLDSIYSDIESDTGFVLPEWDASRIRHVRVWFESKEGQTTPDTIEVADWYFVQSNWRDTLIVTDTMTSTSKFVVASISEDDSTFQAPPGVEAYIDPTTNVTESQRGLLLQYEDLDYRDTCMTIKNLLSVDRYSGYRKLEMYVHGKHGDPTDEGKVLFFFRLGTDSVNYYEQRRIIHDGWNKSNYISMDFNKITAFKDAVQHLEKYPRSEWRNVDTTDGDLRIRGNPNLNEIKFFAAGIINTDSLTDSKVSGEVWLDELRVTEVRRDVGMAGRISFSGNIADLGNYSFSFQSKDPYFRGLSTSTRGGSSGNLGSGQTQTSLAYNTTLNLDRFFPKSWGARLPVTYGYNKSTATPLLRNGSDIVLPEEIRIKERSIAESQSFSVSGSFSRKGRNPLFNLFLNRIKTSFSYRRNTRTSVNTPYSFGENYNLRSSFDLGVKKPPSLPIFFWTRWIPVMNRLSESRLGLYPSSWSMSGGYDRNLQISDDVDRNRRASLKRNLNAKMDINYPVFQNLSVSFHYDTRRDLSNEDDIRLTLRNPKIGLELHFSQSMNINYRPRLLSFISTDLSYQASYSDDWERSSETRRSNLGRSWGVKGSFDHIKLFGGKGSRRGGYNQGRRGRGGRRAGSDTDFRNDKNKKKKQGSGKPFYDPPLAVLRFFTGWIKPITYSYSENYNMSLPGMKGRPGMKYRLGFTREPDVVIEQQGRNPNSAEGLKYEFSSGFKLLGGISTDVRFRRNINKDLVKKGKRYKKVSTQWPDLKINISRFKHLPLLKGIVNKFIDVFSPRTGFSRSVTENHDLDGGFITSRSTSISQSPLLGVNFKLLRTLSLSSTYTVTKDIKEDFNPNTGEFQSEGRTLRKTIGLSSKYSFSSPTGISLPIFGRIKFRSMVSISVDIKKNQSNTENYDSKGKITSSTTKSDLSITPDVAYTFSKQIRGGLRMRWTDSKSRNRTNHLREVQLWVEIRF